MFIGLIYIAYLTNQTKNQVIVNADSNHVSNHAQFYPLLNCIPNINLIHLNYIPDINLMHHGLWGSNDVIINGISRLSQYGDILLIDGKPLSQELKECIANEEKKQEEIKHHFTVNLSQKKWEKALQYALEIQSRQRDAIMQTLVDGCDDLNIREKAIENMSSDTRDSAYQKLFRIYLTQKNYIRLLA